jgi:hypothetical protein
MAGIFPIPIASGPGSGKYSGFCPDASDPGPDPDWAGISGNRKSRFRRDGGIRDSRIPIWLGSVPRIHPDARPGASGISGSGLRSRSVNGRLQCQCSCFIAVYAGLRFRDLGLLGRGCWQAAGLGGDRDLQCAGTDRPVGGDSPGPLSESLPRWPVT